MPVAAPQKDAQIFQHYQHLLPKSPGALVAGSDNYYGHESIVSDIGHLHSLHQDEDYFSPHSPPILNLSPHLSSPDRTSPTQRVSPTNRTSPNQRGSPFYDLRESTRRRTFHGEFDWSKLKDWNSLYMSCRFHDEKSALIKVKIYGLGNNGKWGIDRRNDKSTVVMERIYIIQIIVDSEIF